MLKFDQWLVQEWSDVMLDQMLAAFEFDSSDLIPLVAIGGGLLIAAISSIMWCIVTTVRTKEAERTRREIAAYVSEGTITPDEGERLMRTAGKHTPCS